MAVVLEVVGKITQLESLELGDMMSVTETHVIQGFSQLTKLRHLRLEKGQRDCPTDAILRTISLLPSLIQLELINFDVRAGFEVSLARCSNIKILLMIPTYVTQPSSSSWFFGLEFYWQVGGCRVLPLCRKVDSLRRCAERRKNNYWLPSNKRQCEATSKTSLATSRRHEFLQKRKAKKHLRAADLGYASESNIYVNESLTSPNRKLLQKTREVARKKGYQYVWTLNCSIYVRKATNDKAVKILTEASLDGL
ncbi:hypothetical protein J6590_022691 [Homalodisca vitripennis]|nr:hypothetical protein J6590_022691 [Homalodisca vitripennis]